MTVKKIIITKPKTDSPFDLGEMLFVDESNVVTKIDKNNKVVVVGTYQEKSKR